MKLLLAFLALLSPLAGADSVLLKAMRDELARERTLQLRALEKPYFIEYTIDDAESFRASATLGGLVSARQDRYRLPRIRVRVGDYNFDNTNYAGGFGGSGGFDLNRFPLDDVYALLRRYLWLSTDVAYKSALQQISRKRAALKNISLPDQVPDFAPAEPVKHVEEVRWPKMEPERWTALARSLSGVFREHPELRASSVDVEAVFSVRHLVNSEGTEVRDHEQLFYIRARANAQAADGMTVRDAALIHRLDFDRAASEPEAKKELARLAANVTALLQAPRIETYSGPVLFEGTAGAQVFAEVLGENFVLTRRPVMDPGRNFPFTSSELEGRQGARILPEYIDIVDDPARKQMLGSYAVDNEGVPARPVTLVEKGVLKNFLLTRQPVRGFNGSNGRARLSGGFGGNTAGISNLIVTAHETVPAAGLKKKLMEICQTRNKPYGIIVRKMDFPSSASLDEMRRLLSSSQGGSSRPVSLPALVYRVYPDGREELVRGLRFRGLNARSFKDILAAGDDRNVFEFLDNNAPFAFMGAGGYVSPATAVAPSVLIDDLELQRMDDEQPKPPVVPAPK